MTRSLELFIGKLAHFFDGLCTNLFSYFFLKNSVHGSLPCSYHKILVVPRDQCLKILKKLITVANNG